MKRNSGNTQEIYPIDKGCNTSIFAVTLPRLGLLQPSAQVCKSVKLIRQPLGSQTHKLSEGIRQSCQEMAK